MNKKKFFVVASILVLGVAALATAGVVAYKETFVEQSEAGYRMCLEGTKYSAVTSCQWEKTTYHMGPGNQSMYWGGLNTRKEFVCSIKPNKYACVMNKCGATCETNSDCGTGYTCLGCECKKVECTKNSQCLNKAKAQCKDGKLPSYSCDKTTNKCKINTSKMTCSKNSCKAECRKDSDCSNNGVCNQTTCKCDAQGG